MFAPDGKKIVAYDIEVFPNFFLAQFYDGERCHQFRESSIQDMIDYISDRDLVLGGFNSFGYDDIVLAWLVSNPDASTRSIYELSKRIIEHGRNDQQLFRIQYGQKPWAYSIDLFQFFNKRGSLKEWQCKSQYVHVVESHHDFDKPLPRDAHDAIIRYCQNDVLSTWHLIAKNYHLIEIRADLEKRYRLTKRVHVVGEAGLAQAVFMAMHTEKTGRWINIVREEAENNPDNKRKDWPANLIVSNRVTFMTSEFQDFLVDFKKSVIHSLDPRRAKWALDKRFQLPIKLGQREYQLGVGGLHSVDGPGRFEATDEKAIIDLDVESYYPSIIIEENLFPAQIGQQFVEDLRGLRDTRLDAKHKEKKLTDPKEKKHFGRINAALKIVINSTFGKLNDSYSPIRSVPDALRVTINGQLMLLMLIEMLENDGAEILSCNTDGVTVRWYVDDLNRHLPAIMEEWSHLTGHKLERADFKKYVRRDVNAYIALKTDGTVKRKGAFTPYPDTGKWDGVVVKLAAEKFLLEGIDPAKFICDKSRNPLDFLYYQRVKNGGTIWHGDMKVGRVARWYASKTGDPIMRENPDKSRDTVPNGHRATLALSVPDWKDLGLPDDIDFDHYVKQAHKLINTTKEKKNAGRSKKSRKSDEESDRQSDE